MKYIADARNLAYNILVCMIISDLYAGKVVIHVMYTELETNAD